MKPTMNNPKTRVLLRAITLTVLATAIASLGYGWHRAVSAQSQMPQRSDQALVFNGKILFTRFVSVNSTFIAKVFIVDPDNTGSESCLGMCTDANDSRDGQNAAWSPDGSTIAFTARCGQARPASDSLDRGGLS